MRHLGVLLRRWHQSLSSRLSFNASWFETEPQTAMSTKQAVFSGHSLAEQVAAFEANGFVLMRTAQTSTSLGQLTELEGAILGMTSAKQATGLVYKLARAFNFWGEYSVRSPEKRHSIPLQMSENLSLILNRAIGNAHPFLSSQLASNAPLIDVSSIISFPGSSRQRTHSDVPFGASKIIVGFVALSAVSMASGPTCLFAGSHKKTFHDQHVSGASEALLKPKHYTSDGEAQDVPVSDVDNASRSFPSYSASDLTSVAHTATSLPSACILEAGDVLLYDSSIFHYGGANVSELPRSLLMFSFQESLPWGGHTMVDGFTYNNYASIKGQYTIDSFSPLSVSGSSGSGNDSSKK